MLHQRVAQRLSVWLDDQLPDDLTALSDFEVVVESGPLVTVRAPDVVIIRDLGGENAPRVPAGDVLVAVEVVSPSTGRTDRLTKPVEYADAGIPHYWLVEMDPLSITAYTLVDGDYEVVAQSSEILSVLEPVPMTIDVQRLIKRR
jgi:Uma2 family endonuclease